MPYRSSSKTRQKKDAKRTTMMQAAIRVFAKKGYHAATIRDIVSAADVAIGTFYFYFPDKETLFIHLYEETADFLLQAVKQAALGRTTFPQQLRAGLQAYVNIAVYEPAVIQLLLTGGNGSISSLSLKQANYRRRFINIWQELLEGSLATSDPSTVHYRRTAEALAGAYDEVIWNLIALPNPELEAATVVDELVRFSLRATAYGDH
jgi:AcrR family transcriptional regulator